MFQVHRYNPIELIKLSAFIFLPLLLALAGCQRNITEPPTGNRIEQTAKWVDVSKAEAEHSPIHIFPSSIAATTIVEFELLSEGRVTLTIDDGQDIIIATLVDHMDLLPGRYESSFNASNLASGVYLYTLDIAYRNSQGQFVPAVRSVRKMMLIK